VLEESIRQRIESLRLILLAKAQKHGPRDTSLRIPVEEIEDTVETAGSRGRCILIDKDVTRYLDSKALEAAATVLLADGPRVPGFCFLDLETTGFSSSPLFLAGTLFQQAGQLRVRQLLARDYSEEAAVIAELDELLSGFAFCVTFNGKSFDIPYLRERAKYHRIALGASPEQFDLLHHSRRQWKHSLPNCRLITLEWHILGRRRVGDVPGWEVPCIYHEFVHTKDARKIKNVLQHNLIDVLSMAELFVSLAEAKTC
jgi:uncharacterized protein YprB with RNaseH-like and TPR domain